MIENSQANSFNFCYQTSTIPTARKNAKINRIFPPVNKCLMAIFRIIIRTFPNYFLKKLFKWVQYWRYRLNWWNWINQSNRIYWWQQNATGIMKWQKFFHGKIHISRQIKTDATNNCGLRDIALVLVVSQYQKPCAHRIFCVIKFVLHECTEL